MEILSKLIDSDFSGNIVNIFKDILDKITLNDLIILILEWNITQNSLNIFIENLHEIVKEKPEMFESSQLTIVKNLLIS